MHQKVVEEYYSRNDIAKAISESCQGREAVGSFGGKGYDSRPNIIQYPSDVASLVKKGITSFHISVEKWQNVMQLSAERDYSKLRTGWDLLVDIDSKVGIEAARVAALVVCNFLEQHGVRSYGIKFSGSRGFHICVPWSAFPAELDYKPLAKEYPETARIIIGYMREKIRTELMQKLRESVRNLGEDARTTDPYKIVEIEKEWGPRHLFRAPYSLNEKTWYVSVPLTLQELRDFNVSMAVAQNIDVAAKRNFFAEDARAEKLLREALDWHALMKKEELAKRPVLKEERRGKAPEQYFPPCINAILQGLSEGRKRSVFTLATFLHSVGWGWTEVEQKLMEWNQKNKPPLPQTYIRSQLNWHKNQKRQINSPNCYNDHFLKGIGLCQGELQCLIAKNPMNYPFRKMAKARKIQAAPAKKENIYACEMCERKFESMAGLRGHRTRFHGAE